jgi:large conductance mechanosensitive channel
MVDSAGPSLVGFGLPRRNNKKPKGDRKWDEGNENDVVSVSSVSSTETDSSSSDTDSSAYSSARLDDEAPPELILERPSLVQEALPGLNYAAEPSVAVGIDGSFVSVPIHDANLGPSAETNTSRTLEFIPYQIHEGAQVPVNNESHSRTSAPSEIHPPLSQPFSCTLPQTESPQSSASTTPSEAKPSNPPRKSLSHRLSLSSISLSPPTILPAKTIISLIVSKNPALSFWHEFKKFVIQTRVLETGVGVIIGRAFQDFIRSFVNDMLVPPIAYLSGGFVVNRFYILKPGRTKGHRLGSLEDAVADGAITLNYGRFGHQSLNFLTVGVATYFLLKGKYLH